jgi:hypothetical protein
MANGTIAFDTLSTSGQISGTAKSVDTDYLAYGSVKCWFLFDGTGTVAINDSFNASSLDDDGTGQYGINYSNNFATTSQCAAGDSTSGNAGGTMRAMNFHTTNTTSVEMDAWAISTGSAANSDPSENKGLILGDLA